jgi:hypothetical protein
MLHYITELYNINKFKFYWPQLYPIYDHDDNLLYVHVKVTKKYTASLLVTSKKDHL